MRRSLRRSTRFTIWLTFLLILTALAPLATAAAPRDTARITTRVDAAPSAATTITRFDTTQPVIALTFDAGSDRGYAAQILDILKAQGIRASFGMTGEWAQTNPDLVKRMVNEGHDLMNHTWSHPSFTGYSTGQPPLSADRRRDQIVRTEQLIASQTGFQLQPLFRPPYGDYDASVLTDIAALGYSYNIMWTVDTLGWNGASVATIQSRVVNAAAPGAIVLMHVGADSQDAAALPGVIDQLRARGYRFATVRDFINNRIGPEQRYFPETGHWVSHGFLAYWNTYGGLPVFGYPITDEYTDPTTGLVTQYFERARFEWHPGAWPSRFDVLLGLLGNEVAAQKGLVSTRPFQPLPATTGSDQNCTFYPQTGHRLCFGFRAFWQQHGGLAIFGYPISEEYTDPQTGLTVQYFERQRFEYHPENPPAWQVEGGLLGKERLGQR